ncbi:unnamed protein product [Closterium sp. NIES-53]
MPARRALLQPARRALLPWASRPAAASASRSAALRVAPCCSKHVVPYWSPRVTLCYSVRRALLPCTAHALLPCPPRALPCSPRRPLPCPAALPSPAEPRSPARAALTNPSRAALPRSPAPPSRPAATNAAASGGAAGSTGSVAGARGAGGATESAGGAAGAGGAGPTTARHCLLWPLSRQLQRLGVDSGVGGGFGFLRTAQRRQQSQQETFSPQVLSELVPQRCVTGSVEAAALGASKSAAALGASESAAAPDASESAAALGARASPAIGPSSAEALHTFILDSGASRCFFRDCTAPTPLAAPVPVSLADPTRGLVVARASTVLLCPAVPSGSLSGLHLPTFSTNLVSNAAIQDVWVDTFIPGGQRVAISSCSYRVLSHQTLLWYHRLGHPSLQRLHCMHSRLLVFGLPRSLPSLPHSPTPPCLPCVEGRQRAAPHSSEFPPTTAPLQTLHMDVWSPAPVGGTDQERYFLLLRERFSRDFPVLRLHSDRGGEFSSDILAELCRDEGIHQSFTLPASPQQNGIAERRIGLIMEVARTSMIHAAAPHFLWPFAV